MDDKYELYCNKIYFCVVLELRVWINKCVILRSSKRPTVFGIILVQFGNRAKRGSEWFQ